MPESEAERLQRLREKQLRDRDPLEKERKFQHSSSLKEKRMRKPLSLAEDWGNIPQIVKVPVFGLIIGLIATYFIVRLWDWQYAIYVGVGATLFLIIFGAVLGNALDLREDIKKHLK